MRMRKNMLFLLLTLLVATSCNAQKRYGLYPVAFYNLENIFDTIHDEGKNDYEYLPDGGMKWTPLKYEPFCVTIDFDTENDGAVTVRDRDTMAQVRLPISELRAYLEEKVFF